MVLTDDEVWDEVIELMLVDEVFSIEIVIVAEIVLIVVVLVARESPAHGVVNSRVMLRKSSIEASKSFDRCRNCMSTTSACLGRV